MLEALRSGAQAKVGRPTARRQIAILLLAAAAYSALQLYGYDGTALGRHPVLDGKENLLLAEAMATGQLPQEPFYRAPLYAALLSLPLRAGLPVEALPSFARILNGLLHLATTQLVFAIALRLWSKERCALLAAGLFGFYPVALHYAGDPLDTSLATFLLVLGAHALLSSERTWRAAAIWTLGALVRPHLLVLALAAPMLALARKNWGDAWRSALSPALGLIAFGLVNLAIGGQFMPLPAQGAFNLWAANRAETHGKYFEHSMPIRETGTYINPARREAELLLESAGLAASDAVTPRGNAYWRSQTRDAVLADPIGWLDRTVLKANALLHDREQYNNKTYAFHKALSPLLRVNPLGWGLLLVLTVGSLLVTRPPRKALVLLGTAGVFLLGVLAFYVSGRFRFPVVPLLAAVAGGVLRDAPRQQRVIAGALAAATAALTFAPNGFVATPSTDADDAILVARASLNAGHAEDTSIYAGHALVLRPDSAAAKELMVLGLLNQLFAAPSTVVAEDAFRRQAALATEIPESPVARYAGALFLWRLGEREQAVATWHLLLRTPNAASADALAALIVTGHVRATDHAGIDGSANLRLQLARRCSDDQGGPCAQLRALFGL